MDTTLADVDDASQVPGPTAPLRWEVPFAPKSHSCRLNIRTPFASDVTAGEMRADGGPASQLLGFLSQNHKVADTESKCSAHENVGGEVRLVGQSGK